MTAKRPVSSTKDSVSCLEREANALRVRAVLDMDEEDDVSLSMLAIVTGLSQAPQLREESPVKRRLGR